ncbi:MAG: tetratricopeptide repeat protein [Deltaproteobacteria bacterium]|nr:tetratricopeptide repeat protein [Deltaproteobacteria bacterium]
MGCRSSAAGLVAIVLAAGCSTTLKPGDREAAFAVAVEVGQSRRPEAAARATWAYLSGATEDDPRYDRAVRLMARAAESMGFSYAASLWYLEIAQARRDVTLLPEAVRGLERIILGGPHDEEVLINGFLGSAELSELPPDIQAFVDFHQGVASIRNDLDHWASDRFSRIPESSIYFARMKYVRAVELVKKGKLKEAAEAFEAILELDALDEALKADVHRSLARLHFENGKYDDALEHYQIIREMAPGDPELLLEMAWAHYYEGDSRRALGLLYALDAPVYADLIAPERFLLEALCLRRLCQFGPARNAAIRLAQRHGDAVGDIYSGVPLGQSKVLQAAAAERGLTRKIALYRKRLEEEKGRIALVQGTIGAGLANELHKIYDAGIAEAKRREAEMMALEVDELADALLQAEEGVRLILHELGVALLRGRRPPEGATEATAVEIPTGGDQVFYRFEGEFWTDELDDFVVYAEDRCID